MKKSLIIVFLILAICFFSWFGFGVLTQAGGDDNTSGYAWSENIGWVSFNSTSDESPIDYGVNINETTGYLEGYAWSENIGWVSFERADTGPPPPIDHCPGGGCIAKVSDPTKLGSEDVDIIGWARVLANDSSWDGWIRFDHGQLNEPYIDTDGDWHGWAWSDIVVGWLSFNSIEGGGSDYKVTSVFPVCTCEGWVNLGCGVAPCLGTEMKQTRTCIPPGCELVIEQCVFSSACIVCGNDIVEPGEECDGTDDAACPGECYPPGDAQECTCPDGDWWRWWETKP